MQTETTNTETTATTPPTNETASSNANVITPKPPTPAAGQSTNTSDRTSTPNFMETESMDTERAESPPIRCVSTPTPDERGQKTQFDFLENSNDQLYHLPFPPLSEIQQLPATTMDEIIPPEELESVLQAAADELAGESMVDEEETSQTIEEIAAEAYAECQEEARKPRSATKNAIKKKGGKKLKKKN